MFKVTYLFETRIVLTFWLTIARRTFLQETLRSVIDRRQLSELGLLLHVSRCPINKHAVLRSSRCSAEVIQQQGFQFLNMLFEAISNLAKML